MMERLQSDQALDFNGFTSLIHKLIIAAWGKGQVTFTQRYPNGTDPCNVNFPVITYHSRRKQPGVVGKNTQEIKPRFREYVVPSAQDPNRQEVINVFSQVFDHEVVFDVWAETNVEADQLADRFEDFIMTYTGYLMKQGVQRMVFLDLSDTTSDSVLKDSAVVRSFSYLVRLEKHVAVPTSTIQEVIGKVGVISLDATSDSIDESILFKNQKGGNHP